MLNKEIHIYCSNSYEVLENEYPIGKECLVEFDSENERPRGIKEICEHFIELLNEDCDAIIAFTLSDIPLNIIGQLISDGILDYKKVTLTFVGVDEDTSEIVKRNAGYTNEGFGDANWPLGSMSSWYGFYKTCLYKFQKDSLKNDK